MSYTMMTKRCVHCKRTYTYNPTAGDMGSVCKYCFKHQTTIPQIKAYQM